MCAKLLPFTHNTFTLDCLNKFYLDLALIDILQVVADEIMFAILKRLSEGMTLPFTTARRGGKFTNAIA